MRNDVSASALPTGPSQAEPEVSALRASVPSAAPKVAQPGVQMLRLSDARGAAHKIKAYALRAMKLAELEGRDADRDHYLAKVRTATAVIQEIIESCPVFINAQAIEARKGQDGKAGLVHESAVAASDAPAPSGDACPCCAGEGDDNG